MPVSPTDMITVSGKFPARKIAVCQNEHARSPVSDHQEKPSLLWLNGFRSDMTGTKVTACHDWASRQGMGSTSFDYSGHGASEGIFETGTISQWLEDTIAVFEEKTKGPVVLVGSSMGGWMSLLLTLHHLRALGKPEDSRIKGLVLIAPAFNMTTDLIWMKMDDDIRRVVELEGVYMHHGSEDDAPIPITQELIKDGAWHQIEGKINLHCPVRILQGMKDTVVPWRHALRLMHIINDPDIHFHLVKDGEHRLSSPEQIEQILGFCDELSKMTIMEKM